MALVRHAPAFAAGVDICGMSDLLTFYRDTEPWIAAAAVTKYGDPVHDAALLAELSPLHQAEAIDVPLLVVHGELDTNVPLGEATQIVARLRELGRTGRVPRAGRRGARVPPGRLAATLLRELTVFLSRALHGSPHPYSGARFGLTRPDLSRGSLVAFDKSRCVSTTEVTCR